VTTKYSSEALPLSEDGSEGSGPEDSELSSGEGEGGREDASEGGREEATELSSGGSALSPSLSGGRLLPDRGAEEGLEEAGEPGGTEEDEVVSPSGGWLSLSPSQPDHRAVKAVKTAIRLSSKQIRFVLPPSITSNF